MFDTPPKNAQTQWWVCLFLPRGITLWSFIVLKVVDFTNPKKDYPYLKESQSVHSTRVQKLTVS